MLEYAKGGTFSELLNLNRNLYFHDYSHNQANMSFKEIQFYVAEMVVILELLHTNGIVHRDFKVNVFIF